MSSYAHAVLGDGENIVYRAAVSHWEYTTSYLLSGALLLTAAALLTRSHGTPIVIGALIAGLGVLIAFIAFVKQRGTELVLTDRCVIAKWGLLSRNTVEMTLDRVESLHVSQTLLGRILNYGDVTVVGVGASLEPLHGIKNPLELRKRIGAGLHQRR